MEIEHDDLMASVTLEVQLGDRPDRLPVRGWRLSPTGAQAGDRTFVIIHGVGLSHRVYGRLASQLARCGTVIGIDLPGFGGLARPSHPVSIEDLAKVTAELLHEMGVAEYVAIGHSMGAQVALELAIIDSARAQSLVFVGPVVNPIRRTLGQQGLALARDTAREPVATNLLVLRDYLACGVRWYVAETLEMMSYRIELRVRAATVPVLVLRGEHDPIAQQEWCVELARLAPRGESATIPRHRHVVAHSDGPAVAQEIIAFAARTLAP
jgi:pimeloyl-ACP methyl ester carboxylesterase